MSDPKKPDDPPIELDHTLWCPRHLEPLRAEWPKGFGMALIAMFHHAVQSDKIHKGSKGQTELIQVALKVNAPVCCNILGDKLSRKIIREALKGKAHGVPKPKDGKRPGTQGPDRVE